jgi:hypothetical protein
MSSYPEHSKMKNLKVESRTVGEFIEWLSYSEKVHFCNHFPDRYICSECGEVEKSDVRFAHTLCSEDGCHKCRNNEVEGTIEFLPEGYYSYRYSRIEALIAKFLEIDLNTIENEKRAMLDELRAHSAGATSISDV